MAEGRKWPALPEERRGRGRRKLKERMMSLLSIAACIYSSVSQKEKQEGNTNMLEGGEKEESLQRRGGEMSLRKEAVCLIYCRGGRKHHEAKEEMREEGGGHCCEGRMCSLMLSEEVEEWGRE